MVDTPEPPSNPPDAPASALDKLSIGVSKDALRKRNAEQSAYIQVVNERLAVITQIATLAVARLGGTMRINDEEWASAIGSDFQWRTVRLPGLQPEIHVACTLLGETVTIPVPPVN